MSAYQKPHTPAKKIVLQSDDLQGIVRRTLGIMSDAVGATLGPGGRQVLIESQEQGLPNVVTKDGVTVARALGFKDPTMHVIMESARDPAVRTAIEAGDGTTTATVLAEAIVRFTQDYCRANPRVSPQKVVRILQKAFRDTVEPTIKRLSVKIDTSSAVGRKRLHNVAMVSANGDALLADAVLECFDVVGDDGNVTLSELPGPSEYRVEPIRGYPIAKGYDESCQKFYPAFLNDRVNQRVWMEKPVFVLYHGAIHDLMTLVGVMGMAWQGWRQEARTQNVVLVATGFSEQVLGHLAASFTEADSLNVFPLLVPLSPIPNGQKAFLEDLSAVTGATLFDPLTYPLPVPTVVMKSDLTPDGFDLDHLGSGIESFECHRTKSTIIGNCDDALLLRRSEELRAQAKNAESILDKSILEERIGKLTGGIARLIVVGSSTGEIRECKDRAEDAVRAVQGAVKHGCLPAGGWTLLRVREELRNNYRDGCDTTEAVVREILCRALSVPFSRLLENVGLHFDEIVEVEEAILSRLRSPPKKAVIYDALNGEMVEAFKAGLLDSTPAVLEAIRCSLSIASLLGSLGAVVNQYRDYELERSEAAATADFLRSSTVNEANERA